MQRALTILTSLLLALTPSACSQHAEKTAEEVDHVGKDGLKMSVVAIKSVDQGAKTVTVKTAEGGEETYRMADRAARESGKGLEKAGKVTMYYSEEAGKKIAHFFKSN